MAPNDDRKVRVWDAATGEAVTAAIPHTGEVAFARMNAARRLITASHPDQLWAWDFSETSLPPEVLADYARLVSGRRVDASGVILKAAVHPSADGADGADGGAEMTAPEPGEDVTLQVNGTPDPSS